MLQRISDPPPSSVTKRLRQANRQKSTEVASAAVDPFESKRQRLRVRLLEATYAKPDEHYKLFELRFVPSWRGRRVLRACFIERRPCRCNNHRGEDRPNRCVGYTAEGEVIFSYPRREGICKPVSALNKWELEAALRWFISKPAA